MYAAPEKGDSMRSSRRSVHVIVLEVRSVGTLEERTMHQTYIVGCGMWPDNKKAPTFLSVLMVDALQIEAFKVLLNETCYFII